MAYLLAVFWVGACYSPPNTKTPIIKKKPKKNGCKERKKENVERDCRFAV